MPVHYARRDSLEAVVAEAENKGEKIASVVPEGDNFWVFTTRGPGRPAGTTGGRETR